MNNLNLGYGWLSCWLKNYENSKKKSKLIKEGIFQVDKYTNNHKIIHARSILELLPDVQIYYQRSTWPTNQGAHASPATAFTSYALAGGFSSV